jgi:hypothetical protein
MKLQFVFQVAVMSIVMINVKILLELLLETNPARNI